MAMHHVKFKSLPVGHLIPGLKGYNEGKRATSIWLMSVGITGAVYLYSWWKPQCWLKVLEIHPLWVLYFCSSDVYRHESGRCRSLSFILMLLFCPSWSCTGTIKHWKWCTWHRKANAKNSIKLNKFLHREVNLLLLHFNIFFIILPSQVFLLY